MRANKTYSQAENDAIAEMLGKYCVDTIAKNLGRSTAGVMNQIYRLGLGNVVSHTGSLTASELARICKVDQHVVVRNWIGTKGLKATRKRLVRGRQYWQIEHSDFWEWAEKHKDIINFGKIDRKAILPEPSWVDAERLKANPCRQHQKPWTDEEVDYLIKNFGKLSTGRIAKKLDRLESSIQRKVSRLRKQNKMPFDKVVLRWTEEEIQEMLRLDAMGIEDEEIANRLGRYRDHIVDKRRCMVKLGQYPARNKREYTKMGVTK